MQSTWAWKAAGLKPREVSCDTGRISEQSEAQPATTLPRRLVNDGWWLVDEPRQSRSRPKLRLVPTCGVQKP
jgi:hypothetical protein